MREKIYTESFRCVICEKVIGEYAAFNKERTIRSWVSVCNRCYSKLENKVSELDERISALENNN